MRVGASHTRRSTPGLTREKSWFSSPYTRGEIAMPAPPSQISKTQHDRLVDFMGRVFQALRYDNMPPERSAALGEVLHALPECMRRGEIHWDWLIHDLERYSEQWDRARNWASVVEDIGGEDARQALARSYELDSSARRVEVAARSLDHAIARGAVSFHFGQRVCPNVLSSILTDTDLLHGAEKLWFQGGCVTRGVVEALSGSSASFIALEELDFVHTHFTDASLAALKFASFPRLRSLIVIDASVTSDGIVTLAEAPWMDDSMMLHVHPTCIHRHHLDRLRGTGALVVCDSPPTSTP